MGATGKPGACHGLDVPAPGGPLVQCGQFADWAHGCGTGPRNCPCSTGGGSTSGTYPRLPVPEGRHARCLGRHVRRHTGGEGGSFRRSPFGALVSRVRSSLDHTTSFGALVNGLRVPRAACRTPRPTGTGHLRVRRRPARRTPFPRTGHTSAAHPPASRQVRPEHDGGARCQWSGRWRRRPWPSGRPRTAPRCWWATRVRRDSSPDVPGGDPSPTCAPVGPCISFPRRSSRCASCP